MVSRGTRLTQAAVLLGMVACEPANAPLFTVADSAGVRITLSVEASAPYALVDSVPVLSIGGPDETGPRLFSNISGVLQDARGRLWVADGQSAEVRIFERDGTHARTIGRRGEGPGEFMRVRLLGRFAGDSIAVWDDALGRLTIVDHDGNVARSVTSGTGEAAPPNGFLTYPDGTVLARIREVLPAGALEPGAVIPDTAVFARVDYSAGVTEPLGGAPAPRWIWTGRSSVPIPFLLNPGFDLAGTELHVTSGTAFRIRVFEGDGLTRSYGIDRGPAPVTGVERSEYERLFGGSTPDPGQNDYLSVLNHPEVPSWLPAYRNLVVAEDGTVWAERYRYGDFDVFNAAGVLLGKVDVPLTLTQVGDSTLIGVWRDDYLVEHVRIYRYRRMLP